MDYITLMILKCNFIFSYKVRLISLNNIYKYMIK